jgi:hypothetical protein
MCLHGVAVPALWLRGCVTHDQAHNGLPADAELILGRLLDTLRAKP